MSQRKSKKKRKTKSSTSKPRYPRVDRWYKIWEENDTVPLLSEMQYYYYVRYAGEKLPKNARKIDWPIMRQRISSIDSSDDNFMTIFNDLITNPFPNRALLYDFIRRNYLLSKSMAQELIWRLLRDHYWNDVSNYFVKLLSDWDSDEENVDDDSDGSSDSDSDLDDDGRFPRFVGKIQSWFGATFYGITCEFIESQIILIHAVVIRRGREFEDVYQRYFTNLRRFYANFVRVMFVENGAKLICLNKEKSIDDDQYFVVDSRVTFAQAYVSNYPDLDTKFISAAALPAAYSIESRYSNNAERKLRKGVLLWRFCGIRQSDFESIDGDGGSLVFEELFDLASGPGSSQMILDLQLQRALISPTMCHELCWFYLPSMDPEVLRRHENRFVQAIQSTMSLHYGGSIRDDVRIGYRKLIDYLEKEIARGITADRALSDERRMEIFEAKARSYRLLRKSNLARYSLARRLLQPEEEADDDLESNDHSSKDESKISSRIAAITQSHSWTIGELLRLHPTLLFEWRRVLIEHDWMCLVDSLTRGRRFVRFYWFKYTIFVVNLWRLMSEFMHRFHVDSSKSSSNTHEGRNHAAILERAFAACPRLTSEKAQQLLESGLCNLGDQADGGTNSIRVSISEAISCFTSTIKNNVVFSYLRPSMWQDFLPIYHALSIYYELVHSTSTRGHDYSRSLKETDRLLRTSLISNYRELKADLRGTTGAFECLIDLLNRADEAQEAAECADEYLERNPDDIASYDVAIRRLDPEFAPVFARRLIGNANFAWHAMNVDWSRYKIENPPRKGDRNSDVARKLMECLDYGKNKEKTDVWKLLDRVLAMIDGEEETEKIRGEWIDRKIWWKKFHRNRSEDERELNEMRESVFEKLGKFD